MSIDFQKLADPFPADDIEWRVQSSGKKGDKVWARVLAYVTSRAVQERLDAVCGPGNWQNLFTTGPGGGVLCGISIRVPFDDGSHEWVTKWDGSENTDVEAVKGGLSGAMKRAAVQWGIGRYLYDLPAGWAQVVPDKNKALHSDKVKGQKGQQDEWFHWNPPPLPPWALPAGTRAASGAPIGEPPYQPEPAEEPPPPAAKLTVSTEDLKKLAVKAKARGVSPAVVTKLAEERFGRIPRQLRPHEFAALLDRLEFGDWPPDDIDEAMPQKESAA